MKFSHKIIATSSMLLLFTIGVLSASQYITIKAEVHDSITDAVQSSLDAVGKTVTTELGNKIALAEYVNSQAQTQTSRESIEAVINNPTLQQAFLLVGGGLETGGRPLSGKATWNPASDYDARVRPWYKKAKSENTLIVTDPYASASTGDMLISIATPLKADGQFNGALFFDMSLKGLSDLVNDIDMEAGYLFIVDKNNLILAHPNKELNGKKMSALLPNFSIREGDLQETTLTTGEKRLVDFVTIDSLGWYVGAIIDEDIAYQTVSTIKYNTLVFSIVALILATMALSYVMSLLMKPLDLLNKRMKEVASGSGDLTQRLNTNVDQEFAELSNNFNLFTESLHGQIIQLKTLADKILQGAETTQNSAAGSAQAMGTQLEELEQLATAMNEMATTSNDIAGNAQGAAAAAKEAETASRTGSQLVSETTTSINALSNQIDDAVVNVKGLEKATSTIDSVLKVISDISEQTNLLALNAAIEAARAGDNGRGFAVVADEVRTLAQRTQNSTTEIKKIIEELKASAGSVVDVMQQSKGAANAMVDKAQKVEQSLQLIYSAIHNISDMNLQIASAAEEQSLVAEEINANTLKIKDLSVQVSSDAEKSIARTKEQASNAREQNGVLGRFIV
jgi:methyl-accepting chemotaxis protein